MDFDSDLAGYEGKRARCSVTRAFDELKYVKAKWSHDVLQQERLEILAETTGIVVSHLLHVTISERSFVDRRFRADFCGSIAQLARMHVRISNLPL